MSHNRSRSLFLASALTLPLESRDRGSIQCFAKRSSFHTKTHIHSSPCPALSAVFYKELYLFLRPFKSGFEKLKDKRSTWGVVVLQFKMMESTWLLSHPPPRAPAPSCLTSDFFKTRSPSSTGSLAPKGRQKLAAWDKTTAVLA